MPAMILSSDDLPAPLGPTTPILAPGRKDSVDVVEDDLVAVSLTSLAQGVDELRHSPRAYGVVLARPNRPRWPDQGGAVAGSTSLLQMGE